jgi:hypothetical protein
LQIDADCAVGQDPDRACASLPGRPDCPSDVGLRDAAAAHSPNLSGCGLPARGHADMRMRSTARLANLCLRKGEEPGGGWLSALAETEIGKPKVHNSSRDKSCTPAHDVNQILLAGIKKCVFHRTLVASLCSSLSLFARFVSLLIKYQHRAH